MRQHIPNSFRNLLLLLSICGTQFAYGGNKSWTGSVSTDWAIAGNWNPAGVPSDTDDVTISLSAVNQPVLTSVAHSAALTVQTGALLSISSFNLFTNGSVNASEITGTTGSVHVNGTGITINGKFPNVTIDGSAKVADTMRVTGNLTAANPSGVLDINGKDVTVNGNYTSAYQDYYTGGTLVMKNPSGVLRVMGNVNFDGNPTDTLLTAGTMYVGGTFRIGKNFTATGTHQVIFNGSSVQSINEILDHPHSHFRDMRISNAAGVAINVNVLASGNLRMDSSASLSGTGMLAVGGALVTLAGSSVTIGSIELDSSMSVSGSFTPATTIFNGNNQLIQGGLGYNNVLVNRYSLFGGGATVNGNLTAANPSGVLDINGKDVTVNGNYSSAYQSYYTGGTDRKSTRLNSSHVEISYAVFCLK